jgi:hypothetical protein
VGGRKIERECVCQCAEDAKKVKCWVGIKVFLWGVQIFHKVEKQVSEKHENIVSTLKLSEQK